MARQKTEEFSKDAGKQSPFTFRRIQSRELYQPANDADGNGRDRPVFKRAHAARPADCHAVTVRLAAGNRRANATGEWLTISSLGRPLDRLARVTTDG